MNSAERRCRQLKTAKRALAIDLEGVMFVNCPRWTAEGEALGMKCYTDVLAKLLEGHDDVALVVASSWRAHLDDRQLGEQLPGLRRWYVGSVGMPASPRDLALREWLAANPQIVDFLVLDDQQRLYPGKWPQLVVCNSGLGLGDKNVQRRIAEWLNCDASVAQFSERVAKS